MAALAAPDLITVEEYLAGEQLSDVKHEYVAGRVYAMAGASRGHNQVAGNVFAELRSHLRGGPCQAFIADMKARLKIRQQDIFYYPDVIVTCDPRDTDDYFLRFPKLIIEVLSPSTERLDRKEKFESYLTVPTLEEYVLISQEQPDVTCFRRSSAWEPHVVSGIEAAMHLESVDFTLPLSVVYENVRSLR
jgi:Uma2 family endonuclease